LIVQHLNPSNYVVGE